MIRIDGMDFDDDHSAAQGRENLWRSVLMAAIEDAVLGCRTGPARYRARNTREARDYILIPDDDFNLVCSLAGLDPDAVRERAARMIANAPSVEDLASQKPKGGRHRGAAANLRPFQGTGAGSTAQETPKITFSEKA